VSLQPGQKALRDPKTATAPCGGSEKPPLRAGMGLQSPCPERKSHETAPLTMNMNPNGKSRFTEQNSQGESGSIPFHEF
jgi:hypothetical protein